MINQVSSASGSNNPTSLMAIQFGKIDVPITQPSTVNKLSEWPRVASSVSKLQMLWFPLLDKAPNGDGHPVVVLPGFMTGDSSTIPLRNFLKKLEYDVHTLDLGLNVPLNQRYSPDLLVDKIIEVYNKTGKKVSLVGWSLGGVQAREIAKRVPDMVRGVITLGSPLGAHQYEEGISKSTKRTFEALEKVTGMIFPDYVNAQDNYLVEQLHEAPPVPTTSIYSKKDGVVAWQLSVQESEHKSKNAPSENLEVKSGHFALGYDPAVLYAIAERLAQHEGEWTPFDRNENTLRKMVYPKPVIV